MIYVDNRSVKWLKKDVPKSEFDVDIARSLGYRGTVYHLGGSIVVDNIVRILKNLGVSEIDLEADDADYTSKFQPMKTKVPLIIDDLATATYLPIKTLREIDALLLEKRQVIFYGPPGTSKTYIARRFSEYFTQNIDDVEIIQFHQSYSYEDFVEGIKPAISKTLGIEFSKQPGLFKNLVKKCIENHEKRFVLIIDEVNRGNISRLQGTSIVILRSAFEREQGYGSFTKELIIHCC